MSDLTPLYQGEVWFKRYSDSSTQGSQIVLTLPDRDELQPFVGKEGKRFMCVLVEVGDDERPISAQPRGVIEPKVPANRPEMGEVCRWLVFQGKDYKFQSFVLERAGMDDEDVTEDNAAKAVRAICGVQSRSDIDLDVEALERFHTKIRKPWAVLNRAVTA